ncbi:MAG: TIGR02594 family protein [Bacteroidota bacterium]
MARTMETAAAKQQNANQMGAQTGNALAPPQFKLDASGQSDAVQMKEANDPLSVDQGQITFDAEGNDNARSRYYSRVIHWPGGASGVTMGRGYDLGHRSQKEVLGHLAAAGITGSQATALAAGAGLKGKPAGDWVAKNKDKVGEITHEQQKILFEVVYADLKKDVVRLSTKKDVVAAYGSTDFDSQHPAITDFLVDLRYRGDYHSRSRKWIQEHVAKNDLKKLASIAADSRWMTDYGVPKDRFNRRKQFMQDALAGKTGSLKGNDAADKEAEQTSSGEASGQVIGTGKITASALNVRSGPGPRNAKIGEAIKGGTTVTIYGKSGGWFKIGEKMWVSGKYVEFSEKKEEKKGDDPINSGVITASSLNVRSGPGGSFDKVSDPLSNGASVQVFEQKDGWLRIGKDQWVSGKYVKLGAAEDKAPAKEEPKADQPIGTGMVTASALNVRKDSNGSAEKVDQLKGGAPVTVFEQKDGWLRIGKDMWVSGKYVRMGGAKPKATTGKGNGAKPNWMSVAERELGVKEIVGSKHNPRVIEYHSTTGKFGTDEVPWCASYVNWVHKQSGLSGTGSALAMSYKNWGKDLGRPAYGALAVFSYGGGKGHVGFVVGEQGGKLLILGGNQSNSVKISAFSKSKIVAYVVPSDYEVPAEAYNLSGSKEEVEDGGGMAATR